MPDLDFIVKRIEVHASGESGDAEWRLTVAAESAGKQYSYNDTWHRDDVQSGQPYDIDWTWLFSLSQGETIKIRAYGIEEDGTVFDPDDVLPSFGVEVDPFTERSPFRVDAAGGGTPEQPEFHYTLEMEFRPKP